MSRGKQQRGHYKQWWQSLLAVVPFYQPSNDRTGVMVYYQNGVRECIADCSCRHVLTELAAYLGTSLPQMQAQAAAEGYQRKAPLVYHGAAVLGAGEVPRGEAQEQWHAGLCERTGGGAHLPERRWLVGGVFSRQRCAAGGVAAEIHGAAPCAAGIEPVGGALRAGGARSKHGSRDLGNPLSMGLLTGNSQSVVAITPYLGR